MLWTPRKQVATPVPSPAPATPQRISLQAAGHAADDAVTRVVVRAATMGAGGPTPAAIRGAVAAAMRQATGAGKRDPAVLEVADRTMSSFNSLVPVAAEAFTAGPAGCVSDRVTRAVAAGVASAMEAAAHLVQVDPAVLQAEVQRGVDLDIHPDIPGRHGLAARLVVGATAVQAAVPGTGDATVGIDVRRMPAGQPSTPNRSRSGQEA